MFQSIYKNNTKELQFFCYEVQNSLFKRSYLYFTVNSNQKYKKVSYHLFMEKQFYKNLPALL